MIKRKHARHFLELALNFISECGGKQLARAALLPGVSKYEY